MEVHHVVFYHTREIPWQSLSLRRRLMDNEPYLYGRKGSIQRTGSRTMKHAGGKEERCDPNQSAARITLWMMTRLVVVYVVPERWKEVPRTNYPQQGNLEVIDATLWWNRMVNWYLTKKRWQPCSFIRGWQKWVGLSHGHRVLEPMGEWRQCRC